MSHLRIILSLACLFIVCLSVDARRQGVYVYDGEAADSLPLTVVGDWEIHLGTSKKGNWFDARKICEDNGLQLISLDTREKNDAIKNYLNSRPGADKRNWSFRVWTAGNDMQREKTFLWDLYGKPVTFTDWHGGQPDNHGNNEDCIELVYSGGQMHWNDSPCDYDQAYYLCERS